MACLQSRLCHSRRAWERRGRSVAVLPRGSTALLRSRSRHVRGHHRRVCRQHGRHPDFLVFFGASVARGRQRELAHAPGPRWHRLPRVSRGGAALRACGHGFRRRCGEGRLLRARRRRGARDGSRRQVRRPSTPMAQAISPLEAASRCHTPWSCAAARPSSERCKLHRPQARAMVATRRKEAPVASSLRELRSLPTLRIRLRLPRLPRLWRLMAEVREARSVRRRVRAVLRVTAKRPPCSAAIFCTTASPRPVPTPTAFVVKNGISTFSRRLSGTPGPSSSTTTMMVPSAARSEATCTRPQLA